MSDYPEHDKLLAIQSESQVIGEFLEWAAEKGISLGHNVLFEEFLSERFTPWMGDKQRLLAEFFSIDLDKIEAEKRQMLEQIRAAND